jgi:hypothetical protein
MQYEGVRYDDLSPPQQEGLVDLLERLRRRMRPGHAAVRMDEVRRHLRDTWFAWMGEAHETSVFYYRIHSPVILVEFDHQRGIALDNDQPSRDHIHTVVRTPNGNDYGKDCFASTTSASTTPAALTTRVQTIDRQDRVLLLAVRPGLHGSYGATR